MTGSISPEALKGKLRAGEGGELALFDVREEGVFAQGHLLFAGSLPLSRLELRFRDLVPRWATPIVLLDDAGAEGLAARAAARLESFGYIDVSVCAGGPVDWRKALEVPQVVIRRREDREVYRLWRQRRKYLEALPANDLVLVHERVSARLETESTVSPSPPYYRCCHAVTIPFVMLTTFSVVTVPAEDDAA